MMRTWRSALQLKRRHQARQGAVAELQALPYQRARLDRYDLAAVGAVLEAHLGHAVVVPAELAQPALGGADLVGGVAPQRLAAHLGEVGCPVDDARRRGREKAM